MNYYQLDSKEMDAAFLSGAEVICKVAMNPEEQHGEKIKVDDLLIVRLSNGAKYKGRVVKFAMVPISKYAVGEMTIIRAR
jgi:hypothetical protein